MRVDSFMLVILALLVTAPASARPVPERPERARHLVPDTPRAALRCMAQAYNDRSIERLGALLSADYRFHFS